LERHDVLGFELVYDQVDIGGELEAVE
jgi:hypothetical protein